MSGLALFDLDNTLLDRESAFLTWAESFITRYDLPDGSIEAIIRSDLDGMKPRSILLEELRQIYGLAPSARELEEQYWTDYPACYSVPDSTYDALERLRLSGWKLGIVTNGPLTQWKKIEAANLTSFFDACCISADVGARKPELEMFLEAARRCDAALTGWMVGDSADADVVGGHEAGLLTIWFPRGRTWDRTDISPDATASSIAAAVEIMLASSNSR